MRRKYTDEERAEAFAKRKAYLDQYKERLKKIRCVSYDERNERSETEGMTEEQFILWWRGKLEYARKILND